jgi:hypothetical protein
MRSGTGGISAGAGSHLAINEVVYEFNKPLVDGKASAVPPICHRFKTSLK